jgi:hypothetical protein
LPALNAVATLENSLQPHGNGLTSTTAPPSMILDTSLARTPSNLNTMEKMQIKRVWIEHRADEGADMSELGVFADTATDKSGAIIRIGEHRGQLASTVPADEWPDKGREYRFFIPAMTAEETGNPDLPIEDWKRAEAGNNGEWHYIGIIAKAELWNPQTHVVQVIHSGGLWGIESDAGAEYMGEVAMDELAGLRAELSALGLGSRAIAFAFSRAGKEPVIR